MNFYTLTLRALQNLQNYCFGTKRIKTREEFEKAVYWQYWPMIEEYLNDDEFDVAYENGKILYYAEYYLPKDKLVQLIKSKRFDKIKTLDEICDLAVQRFNWPLFAVLLQNQTVCDRFLRIASNKTYPFGFAGDATYFSHVSLMTNQYIFPNKHVRKSLYRLISKDTVSTCIGLAQLDMACLLLTFLVEHLCQPWYNTVHYANVYRCCLLVRDCKINAPPEIKEQKKYNVLIGQPAKSYQQMPERFIEYAKKGNPFLKVI